MKRPPSLTQEQKDYITANISNPLADLSNELKVEESKIANFIKFSVKRGDDVNFERCPITGFKYY